MLMLGSTRIVAQSYLGLDGGLEGSATLDNITIYSTGQANKWTKANATQSIINETATARSGVNSLKINNSSATGRRLFSPSFTAAIGSNLVIQYYRRSADATNTQGSQTMISLDGVVNAEAGSGSYTNVTSSNTWEKVTYAPSTLTSATALWAGLMHRQSGSGGDLLIDDMAIYVSNVVDNIAPNSSGSLPLVMQQPIL
jgi:hypothetical protein